MDKDFTIQLQEDNIRLLRIVEKLKKEIEHLKKEIESFKSASHPG